MKRIGQWLWNVTLGRLFTVDPDPEVNARLAAVDEDIDHRAEHVNLRLRGYRLLCGRPGCPYE